MKHEKKQACEGGCEDLLLVAAHLFRLRVLKLLNECAEKSGSPERLLMFDLPMEDMNEGISLLPEGAEKSSSENTVSEANVQNNIKEHMASYKL